MRLQSTGSNHVIDSSLDHLTEGKGLVLSSDDQYDFSSVHHRLHSDCKSHAGDLVQVIVEEAAVVKNGLVSKRLDTSSGAQR